MKKKLTADELKVWLSGVYALRQGDWVPNGEQWVIIIDILTNIIVPPHTTTTPKNKISPADFLAWFDGVREMQLDDWVPSLSQWKLILSKAKSLHISKKQTPLIKRQASQHNPPSSLASSTPPPRDVGSAGVALSGSALVSSNEGQTGQARLAPPSDAYTSTFI